MAMLVLGLHESVVDSVNIDFTLKVNFIINLLEGNARNITFKVSIVIFHIKHFSILIKERILNFPLEVEITFFYRVEAKPVDDGGVCYFLSFFLILSKETGT